MSDRPYTITVIGAESTGKSTLARQLADRLAGDYICEFARPYLEVTDGKVSSVSMNAIWYGQLALQHAARTSPRPFVVQDTDLYATVGYWQLLHIEPQLGSCPETLIRHARHYQSDLYLITQSNIPFEPDPLRYGGTMRESLDDYWITLCLDHHLPFVTIQASTESERLTEALSIINERSSLCVD